MEYETLGIICIVFEILTILLCIVIISLTNKISDLEIENMRLRRMCNLIHNFEDYKRVVNHARQIRKTGTNRKRIN